MTTITYTSSLKQNFITSTWGLDQEVVSATSYQANHRQVTPNDAKIIHLYTNLSTVFSIVGYIPPLSTVTGFLRVTINAVLLFSADLRLSKSHCMAQIARGTLEMFGMWYINAVLDAAVTFCYSHGLLDPAIDATNARIKEVSLKIPRPCIKWQHLFKEYYVPYPSVIWAAVPQLNLPTAPPLLPGEEEV